MSNPVNNLGFIHESHNIERLPLRLGAGGMPLPAEAVFNIPLIARGPIDAEPGTVEHHLQQYNMLVVRGVSEAPGNRFRPTSCHLAQVIYNRDGTLTTVRSTQGCSIGFGDPLYKIIDVETMSGTSQTRDFLPLLEGAINREVYRLYPQMNPDTQRFNDAMRNWSMAGAPLPVETVQEAVTISPLAPRAQRIAAPVMAV